MINVLVAAQQAIFYTEELQKAFPSLAVVPAEPLVTGEEHFATTEVLIAGSALTSDIVARMPNLRWVQSYISGTDEIQAALEARPDVLLTSARGLHGPQMAEMALFQMLSLSRDIRTLARNQESRQWVKVPPRVLEHRTVGLVGLGTVGEAIARLCKAFGMTVYAFSRTERPVAGVDRVFSRAQLVERAGELDFLVLVVPHTRETHRLVDRALLEAMKPSAYLVNLARGGVVDESALIDALAAGEIAGAGLDVFDTEPLPADSPLWSFDNVIVTPHLAGQSDRYPEQLLPLLVENFRRYLAGDRDLINVVHPQEAG